MILTEARIPLEKTLKLHSNEEAVALYGSLDENLRFAEKEYHVRVSARNHKLRISGDKSNVESAYRFFLARLQELREGVKFHANKAKEKETASVPAGEEIQGTVSF